jgi:CHASE3 domain sensor protein
VSLIPGAEDCTSQNVIETLGEIEERVHMLEASNKDLRKRLTALQNESSYDAGFRRGSQAALELVEKMQGKHVSNELLESAMNLRSDHSGRAEG